MPSIVIPTLNAESVIKPLLRALWAQTLKPREILVIDSESDDNTASLATTNGARVIRISRSDFDHGGTRNIGVNESEGMIIVFMTQDASPADDRLLEHLVTALRDHSTGLCYGRQSPRKDANPIEQFSRLFNYPDTPILKDESLIPLLGIKTFFCSNVCSAVKRRAYIEVGGFPQRTIMNEDLILAARMITHGYRVAYEPKATVIHSHSYSLREQMKRYFDIGVSLSRQSWILEYSQAEGEGYEFMKREIQYLWSERRRAWIPYAMTDAALKYIGYRLGLSERLLPLWIKKQISLHNRFWSAKT